MGSGPRSGIGELFLPELQKGSSIMPGKVNPVIPEVVLQIGAQVIGNDTAITVGGLQGQFELNVRIPLMARNLLGSIGLLTAASTLLARKCVDGIEANLEGCERSAEGTLAVATALNPYIGYDKASEIVKDASSSGRTLREVAREHGVDEETLDKALDLRKIAAGSAAQDELGASEFPRLPDKPGGSTGSGRLDVSAGLRPGVRFARALVDLRRAAARGALRAARRPEAQGAGWPGSSRSSSRSWSPSPSTPCRWARRSCPPPRGRPSGCSRSCGSSSTRCGSTT